MRIAVLTLVIGDKYKSAVSLGTESKIKYCQKNNYNFIIGGDEVYDKSRPIAWSKIKMIEKYLPNYDYIFVSDADVIIMNDDIKIESFIEKYMNQKILLVSKDWQNINTGNIIIKNCDEIYSLMKNIWKQTQFLNHGWWEQAAFIHLYNSNAEIRDYTYVLEESHLINAYVITFDFNIPETNKYRTGDFLIHLAGIDGISDLENMLKICNNIKEKELNNYFNNFVEIKLN